MIRRTIKRGYVLFVNKSVEGTDGAQEVIDATQECKDVELHSMDQVKGQEYKLFPEKTAPAQLQPEVSAIQEAPNRTPTRARGRTVGKKKKKTAKRSAKRG